MAGVEVVAARSVLGVSEGAAWAEVRAAYLRLVRAHHPDQAVDAADAGVRTLLTAQVTEAYACLAREREVGGDVGPAGPARSGPTVVPTGPADRADATRRLWLDAELTDAFVAMLEVFHLIGVVSYVDRHSAVVEAIVTPVPGEATSFLAFLEPGPEEGVTEAVLGVEPLGRHAPAPLDPLVGEVARLLATERPPAPTSWHA
jgi:hypothetical protein